MTGWPDSPVSYEVNTAVWLAELTRAVELSGRVAALAEPVAVTASVTVATYRR